jgi:hypothetical protein
MRRRDYINLVGVIALMLMGMAIGALVIDRSVYAQVDLTQKVFGLPGDVVCYVPAGGKIILSENHTWHECASTLFEEYQTRFWDYGRFHPTGHVNIDINLQTGETRTLWEDQR